MPSDVSTTTVCKHCGRKTLGVEVVDHLRPMCAQCWHEGKHHARVALD